MLPTLSSFGINQAVYIRKIDKRADWSPEGTDDNIIERARRVAEILFRDSNNTYSFWYVKSEQEFYSSVAALSARRTPMDNNLDFIWITKKELEQCNIQVNPVQEGDCLNAQSLHFNAQIEGNIAIQLCTDLIKSGRDANRCKRAETKNILSHQKNIGCYALDAQSSKCDCQEW
jgi:hypothetical protein